MGKSHDIREVSHSVDREVDGFDFVTALLTCGLSTFGGGSGEVTGHTVTLEDKDGCRGTGNGTTYAEASANARHALDRAHNE